MHVYIKLIKMYNIIMCNLLHVNCTSIKLVKYICNKRMMCLYVGGHKKRNLYSGVGASLSEQPLRHRDVIIVWSAHHQEFIKHSVGYFGRTGGVCMRHELTYACQ